MRTGGTPAGTRPALAAAVAACPAGVAAAILQGGSVPSRIPPDRARPPGARRSSPACLRWRARCRARQEQRGRPARPGCAACSAARRVRARASALPHRRAAQRQPATVYGAVAGGSRRQGRSPIGCSGPAPASAVHFAAHQAGPSPGRSSKHRAGCRRAELPSRAALQHGGPETGPPAAACPSAATGTRSLPQHVGRRGHVALRPEHLVVPHRPQAVAQARHVAGRQLRGRLPPAPCRTAPCRASGGAPPAASASTSRRSPAAAAPRANTASLISRIRLSATSNPSACRPPVRRARCGELVGAGVGVRRGRRAHVAVEEPRLVVQLPPQHRRPRLRLAQSGGDGLADQPRLLGALAGAIRLGRAARPAAGGVQPARSGASAVRACSGSTFAASSRSSSAPSSSSAASLAPSSPSNDCRPACQS